MPDVFWQILLALFAILFSILFLHPIWQDLSYRARVFYSRTFKGVDVYVPQTAYSIPRGLFFFTGAVTAQKNKYLADFMKQQFKYARVQKNGKPGNPHPGSQLTLQSEKNVLTYRQQSLTNFSIITADPENVKAILATKFKDFGFGYRHSAFLPLLGDGIFTLEGSGWSHSRALLRPQFTRQQISHLETIETHVQNLLQKLKGHETKPIEVQELFFVMTLDTASEFLFGESVSLLTGGNPRIMNGEEFGSAFNKAQAVLSRRIRLQRFFHLYKPKELDDWCQICKEFVDSFVDIALKNYKEKKEKGIIDEEDEDCERGTEKKYVFLNEIVKETQDPIILRDQALNIMLAGRDTTSSLLSWVFYMLALHKPVFHRLRQEVVEMFGTGSQKDKESGLFEPITFENLKRFTYLRHVINETMRLFPIIPINTRTANKDTYLPHGGIGPQYTEGAPFNGIFEDQHPIFVPKGTIVQYALYALHRHPTFWGDDADIYRPERWFEPRPAVSEDGTRVSHAWDFLPFNGGPRICLGQQFALNEASYTIVRILQMFKDIQPGETLPKVPKQETQLTMSVAGGVSLKFVPTEKQE